MQMRVVRSLVVAACIAGAQLAGRGTARAATVLLEVYDAAGQHLSYDQVVAVTTAAGRGWRNDLTYRIADGTAVEHQPLRDQGGSPTLDVSEAGVGLSLAWPTAHTGYSTLLVDGGGAGLAGGTVNLTYRAALDYRAKLDAARARRPDFLAPGAFSVLDQRATDLLAAAAVAPTEGARGALGQQALDALAQAFEVLLREDGRQRGRTGAQRYWWGITVDRTTQYPAVVQSASDLVDGAPADAFMRVVFDELVPATSYDGIVAAATAANVHVVGEILDSSAMSKYPLAQWQSRVDEYVAHFPALDVWEVGNEVNGEWLGPQVQEKIEYAARHVKATHPGATTMLTFYWQMGTAGSGATSLFQWIHDHVTPALAADVDVLALSAWIGDAPLGIAHDEVFERLHALFPSQRIVIGELGYWSPGTTQAWWWRSQANPTTTVRQALARHMYLANLAFPYGLGGNFWWYYYDEMFGGTPLWHTVNEDHRTLYGCADADGDGYCDFEDDCPGVADPDQLDADGDGLGDVCDTACPDGVALEAPSIVVKLAPGATDRLDAKGSFAPGVPLDLAATGMAVHLESNGTTVLDARAGGPGAPFQFAAAGSGFRYDDRTGAAGGITRITVHPSTPAGSYAVKVAGRAMSLDGITAPALRLLLGLGAACAETHADTIACSFRGSGTTLRCR